MEEEIKKDVNLVILALIMLIIGFSFNGIIPFLMLMPGGFILGYHGARLFTNLLNRRKNQ